MFFCSPLIHFFLSKLPCVNKKSTLIAPLHRDQFEWRRRRKHVRSLICPVVYWKSFVSFSSCQFGSHSPELTDFGKISCLFIWLMEKRRKSILEQRQKYTIQRHYFWLFPIKKEKKRKHLSVEKNNRRIIYTQKSKLREEENREVEKEEQAQQRTYEQ